MPNDTEEITELFRNLKIIRQRVAELTIEENTLIARIEDLSRTSENDKKTYNIGDRVLITNDIKVKRNTTATRKDRLGTVTKVTSKRIFILTDSGTKTWRAPKNVQHKL